MEYIGQHKHEFGVEPICWTLAAAGMQIAASTYYAFRTHTLKPISAREEAASRDPPRPFCELRCLRGEEGPRPVASGGHQGRALHGRTTHARSRSAGGGSPGPKGRAPRSRAVARMIVLTLSSAISPRPFRTNSGSRTSPTAGHSPTGCMPHSSSTCFGAEWSVRYTQLLADAGAAASVGSTGDSYDNAQIRGDSLSDADSATRWSRRRPPRAWSAAQ